MPKFELDKIGKRFLAGFLLVFILCVVGGGWVVTEGFRNAYLTKWSSTAKGSTAVFKRSNATATIKNTFIDQSADVLGVVISLDEKTTTPLPYRGTDYALVVSTKSSKEDVPVYFGRMGTEGDLFLIIPKPDPNIIYDIIIVNRNYLDYSTNTTQSTASQIELDNKSVEKLVSESAGFHTTAETSSETKKNSTQDSIRLRVGVNTAIKDDTYSPTVLSAKSLLLAKEDGSFAFDFETYWTILYKNELIDNVQKRIEESTNLLGEYQERVKALQERLSNNDKDETALTELPTVQRALETEKQNNERLYEELKEINSLVFNPSLFQDLAYSMFAYNF